MMCACDNGRESREQAEQEQVPEQEKGSGNEILPLILE